MKRLTFALLLLIPPALLAAPFALTNARYGEAPAADAVLTTNGSDAFVLWKSRTTINMTRIVAGEYRIGRPVFSFASMPDVVWTGQYFLAVAAGDEKVVGRLLDATGEPVGDVFTIAEPGSKPRIAWNGKNALLVYIGESSVMNMLLTGTGTAASGGPVPLAGNVAYDVASNGNGFAVVTASPQEVRVTALTATGAIEAQRTAWTFTTPGSLQTVAIASDSAGYLAVGSQNGLIDAVAMNGDGTLGVPFRIGRLETGQAAHEAAVAWNGSGYTAGVIGGRRLLVARVSSHSVQSLDEGRPASDEAAVSMIPFDGKVLMTWQRPLGESLLVADPSEPENGVPVTFAAAHQEPGAAVSSDTATLVTWTETLGDVRTLRAGVRDADGSWTERPIGGDEQALRAASDGTNFLVLVRSPGGVSAVLLDPQAKVLSRTARLPLPDDNDIYTSIAWNGSDYAIAYTNDDLQPALVRVSRNGAMSPPQLLPLGDHAGRISVAALGPGFLVTWHEVRPTSCYPFCDRTQERVLALRVRPDFTLADSSPLLLAQNDAWLVGTAVRDGLYEVYWIAPNGLSMQRVLDSGAPDLSRRVDFPDTGDLIERWDSLEVGSSVNNWVGIYPRRYGAEPTRFFDWWMTLPKPIATPFEDRELIAMPDGRHAWVGGDVHEAAPHHGALRVMLDVPDSRAPVPRAPRATLAWNGRELKIEWSAPAQPVGGYRVEYRIDDGSWNEFPRQYRADERSATWTSVTHGRSYAFRVRAVGENGAGAYSAPVGVSTETRKRRSVR